MKAARAANDVVRFLLELCMLAAFAYWGANTTDAPATNVFLAIATPLAAAAIWGVWLAPRSHRQLSSRQRLPLEILLFGLATAGLGTSGATTAAIAFGAAAAINTTLVHALGE